MAEYDKTSAERIRVEKETIDDEDEDGWKTVTKKYIILSTIFNFLCTNYYHSIYSVISLF